MLPRQIVEFYKSPSIITNLIKTAFGRKNHSSQTASQQFDEDIDQGQYEAFPDPVPTSDPIPVLDLDTLDITQNTQDLSYAKRNGVLSRRSRQLIDHLRTCDRGEPINFEGILTEDDRRVAAMGFYELLVLSQKDAVYLSQENPEKFYSLIIDPAHSFYPSQC